MRLTHVVRPRIYCSAPSPRQTESQTQKTSQKNSIVQSTLGRPSDLHLSYNTSWPRPVLHYSADAGPWTSIDLEPVISGGRWRHAAIPGASSLEFVVAEAAGADNWDKPTDGSNYLIDASTAAAKRFTLEGGAVAPAGGAPVLVVSDLDDTLVGDDEATAAFTQWWQSDAVPAGGRLAFNTGRSLGLFLELLEAKAGVLVEPDLLITAVGTRIYSK
jgi:hypothetical protein